MIDLNAVFPAVDDRQRGCDRGRIAFDLAGGIGHLIDARDNGVA
ncbi:hypothetical protein [Mesorhizobium sp.]|nr:hypothetical protein [Mesorhizobium sp.]